MRGYQTVRDALVARHDELVARFDRVSRDLRHAEEPLDRILDEQSIELENDEVLAALTQSMRKEIGEIEETIDRLDHGEYGVCAECGELISLKRLEALPFTTRCIDCEERAEAG
ncbi:MAG: TraR/DksA family transcriptional regulator [Acidobacteriota bacterium]